jgi:hypothetical protein
MNELLPLTPQSSAISKICFVDHLVEELMGPQEGLPRTRVPTSPWIEITYAKKRYHAPP